MDNEFRYADFEFRATDDGLGTISGVVIRYGDVATLPWGTEEFRAGAFSDLDNDGIIANRMHNRAQMLARNGGDLKIIDDEESMRAEVTLPDTSAGRDTAVEVAKGLLRGMSLEFRVTEDSINPKGHRVIIKSNMFGFGVVDRPAYPQSLMDKRGWDEYRMEYGLYVPAKFQEPKFYLVM